MGKRTPLSMKRMALTGLYIQRWKNCTVFVKNSPVLLDSFDRIIYNSDINANIGIWRGDRDGLIIIQQAPASP